MQEEMGTAQFVSGDIFGNPFKKDRREKRLKKPAEEVVDEIDVRELEDVETDIVIDGQIVNLPAIREEEPIGDSSVAETVDLYIVEDLIRSPRGALAKRELLQALTVIFDVKTLQNLLQLSQRYKRKLLEPLIQQRIDSLVQ